jgi:dipeptidyl aminopeptidase/acylaminoacyl peptidase
MWGTLAAAFLLGSSSAPAVHPSRIVFASSRTGVAQLYSVEPSGHGLAQLTFGTGGWSAPLPSPDGRYVAAFRGSDLWLMQGDGRGARLLADDVFSGPFQSRPSWYRNSRRLVFAKGGAIWTVAVAGGAPRQVTHRNYFPHPDYDSAPAVSPDGRSIAFVRWEGTSVTLVVRRHGRERVVLDDVTGTPAWSPDGKWIAIAAGTDYYLELVRPTGRDRRFLPAGCGSGCDPAWSPDGRRLAYGDGRGRGIHVVAASGRYERLLRLGETSEPAWSPRGKAIVFATTSGVQALTLGGAPRTLVPFGPFEAQSGVGWSWAPTDLDYQLPEETPLLVRVSQGELEARVPITQLSADGDRVAYWLCPHSFGAWRPGDDQPLSLGWATLLACTTPQTPAYGQYVYDLTLAGNRLAYLTGVAAGRWPRRLMLTTLVRGDEGVEIVEGASDYGQADALEGLVGSGSALVYGARSSPVTAPSPETIWRLDGDKPVQITHPSDDLQPLAVDRGRVVARRADGSLELLDLDGGALRTFDVSALGAALAGDDLVVRVPGELRDYGASTGDLRYVWPLPDPSAKLEDLVRGVVVYKVDGVVHLFRLRDGADATVPGALAADLTEDGLFYAYVGEEPWSGRIRFVPFDELPF